MMLPSMTSGSSLHLAPALARSVRRLGHDVMWSPSTRPASIIVQLPWQMTATVRPDSANARTKCTAFGSVRN